MGHAIEGGEVMALFDRYGNEIVDGDLVRLDHFRTGRHGGKVWYMYQIAHVREYRHGPGADRKYLFLWHDVSRTTDWLPCVGEQFRGEDAVLRDAVVLDSPSRPFPFQLRTTPKRKAKAVKP